MVKLRDQTSVHQQQNYKAIVIVEKLTYKLGDNGGSQSIDFHKSMFRIDKSKYMTKMLILTKKLYLRKKNK